MVKEILCNTDFLAGNYYPFGMIMPGRNASSSIDFGARIYDPRIARWGSIDPLAGKGPGVSPFVFVDNCPLVFIDPDGKEKVLVIGEQGSSPSSDKVTRKPGSNERHFLQAGLDQAILWNNETLEQTTLLVYIGTCSQGELDTYNDLATAEGINFKVVESVDVIQDYVNVSGGLGGGRNSDLITDFGFIGLGGANDLYITNYSAPSGAKTGISVDDIQAGYFESTAFHTTSTITLNSCFACNQNYGTSIADAFSRLAGSGGVNASPNYINWGLNKNTNESRIGQYFTHLPSLFSNQNLWNNIPRTGGSPGQIFDDNFDVRPWSEDDWQPSKDIG